MKNGIKFGEPEINVDELRGYKEKVIAKLTGGLAGMAKARKVDIIQGNGQFVGANHIEVSLTESAQYEQATETGAKKNRCLQKLYHRRGQPRGETALHS